MGRRRAPAKPFQAIEPADVETLVALLADVSLERQQQLVDALLDKACGLRFFVAGQKKPGSRQPGIVERQARVVWLDSGLEEEGWFYDQLPDMAAAKLVLEHRIGRPTIRDVRSVDPVIQFICRVPGKKQWRGKDADPDPEVELVDDEEMDEEMDEDTFGPLPPGSLDDIGIDSLEREPVDG